MGELTSRLALELAGFRPDRGRVLAGADADGVAIAVIDVHGDGLRIVVVHYIREDGSWRALRPARPVLFAPAVEAPVSDQDQSGAPPPVSCVWGRTSRAGPVAVVIPNARATVTVHAGTGGWWAWAGRPPAPTPSPVGGNHDRADHDRP